MTEDGHYLIVTLHEGSLANAVEILDLRKPGSAAVPLFTAWDARYDFIGAHGSELYFRTTKGAPRGRVLAVSAAEPGIPRTVVPEGTAAIQDASYVGGRIIANYVEETPTAWRASTGSTATLPPRCRCRGLGGIEGFEGEGDKAETFFFLHRLPDAASHLSPRCAGQPRHLVACGAGTGGGGLCDRAGVLPQQGRHAGPDVHTHRRDVPRDGSAAMLLYGYGGFDVSLTPTYRPAVQRGWRWAAPTRRRTCAAAASTGRPGTPPAR